jgi:hypothetical protein
VREIGITFHDGSRVVQGTVRVGELLPTVSGTVAVSIDGAAVRAGGVLVPFRELVPRRVRRR